jgi:hypothetical protein
MAVERSDRFKRNVWLTVEIGAAEAGFYKNS